jgi:hypothetical protein
VNMSKSSWILSADNSPSIDKAGYSSAGPSHSRRSNRHSCHCYWFPQDQQGRHRSQSFCTARMPTARHAPAATLIC